MALPPAFAYKAKKAKKGKVAQALKGKKKGPAKAGGVQNFLADNIRKKKFGKSK